MQKPYAGGCACGALRYRIEAEPVMTFLCQCHDCQKFTGSGHVAAMIVPKAAVTQEGKPQWYQSPTDSGHIAGRGFCGHCGSSVYAGTTAEMEIIAIMAGSLDEPARYRPGAVIYHASAAPWDIVDPDLPVFPKMPTSA